MKKTTILIAIITILTIIFSLGAYASNEEVLQNGGVNFDTYYLNISGAYTGTAQKIMDRNVYETTSPTVITTTADGTIWFYAAPCRVIGGKITPVNDENKYIYSPDGEADMPQFVSKGAKITLAKPGIYEIFAAFDAEPPEIVTLSVSATVQPTPSKIIADGSEVPLAGYNIADNNYFKLRDIASVITGSERQFDVEWDSENEVINLISGTKYSPVGGELEGSDGNPKLATSTLSPLFKDGAEVEAKAYNIENNNYFMLRDIGALFDFSVSWDGESNSIIIDTSKPYSAQ